MGISIKNDEVEALARELAGRRRVSITEAIRQSLRREVERERLVPRKPDADLLAELVEISERASALVRSSNLSRDEILGYDQFGAPTQQSTLLGTRGFASIGQGPPSGGP